MTKRVAVFDLDGTLADTGPDLIGALNTLLKSEGLPTTSVAQAIERHLVGRGVRPLIKRGFEAAGAPLDDDGVEARVETYLAHYAERLSQESAFFPGLARALDEIEAKDWTLAVCTNKPERLALQFLEEMELLDRFAAVLGADTLPVRKPDARHFLETVARSGGDAARAVMIGDTETDRLAAKNAGAPCVLVTFGYWPSPVAELAPEAIIEHFDELPAVLEALMPS